MFKLKIFISLIAISTVIHAGYSDDLGDATLPFNSHVETIGDLGEIESIIDLRGFIPVKLLSKESDELEWYKVPIKEFVSAFYYDDKVTWLSQFEEEKEQGVWSELWAKSKSYTNKISNEYLNIPTPTPESDLSHNKEKWVDFAYALSERGKELYDSVGGGYGYDDTQPIMILETEYSGLVFMSFRYKGPIENGQYLVAFELSKTGEYKTFYRLYDTFVFSVNTSEAFEDSAPIIAEVVLKIGTISKALKAAHKIYKSHSDE